MKKTFIKKGLREIWAHKLQYFLLALVIGLGVAAYSSFNDFARYRGDGLDQIYSESNFMDLQVTMNYGDTMTAEEVRGIFNENGLSGEVDQWEMRLVYDVFLEHESDGELKITKGQVMGQMIDDGEHPGEAIEVNTPLFYNDDPAAISSTDARECYIERKFSKAYGLEKGDTIDVNRGETSREVKILEQTAVPEFFFVIREGELTPSERSFGVMILPLETAMDLYTDGNFSSYLVNDIVITIKDEVNLENVKTDLQNSFESRGVAVKFTEKDENPSRFFLISDYENDKDSMSIFPIVIFLVSAFGLVMALRRMIRSHRPQIGIFKALGLPNRAIMVFYAVIGIFIAILGTIMGYLLSIPFNMAFLNLGKQLLDFPVDDYNVTYLYYVLGGLISIVLCLSCTMIPAFFAVRVKPIDVIQGREGMSKKKIGSLGTIMGRSKFLPVSMKLTLRNQLRKPFRSLSTVLGVGISLALFLGFMMVLQSAIVALDGTTSDLNWDYEVRMEGFQPYDITTGLEENYSGINTIVPGITLPTIIEPGQEEYGAVIYSSQDLDSIFKLDLFRGKALGSGIIISQYHSHKIGAYIGDTITLELPVLDQEIGYRMEKIEIWISGIHSNQMGTYAFMPLSTMQNLTGLNGLINTAHILVEGGNEIRELENDLITREGISSVTHSSDNENMMEQYMNILLGTVAVMAIISTILAGAIVYIMFRISAREQERDYATMKTLGTTLGKIARLIFQEGAIITSLGIGVGVLGGFGLAHFMLNSAEEWEVLNMGVVFSWPAFILGSVMIIFAVLLVSAITMRYIAKINIANVIRERAAG